MLGQALARELMTHKLYHKAGACKLIFWSLGYTHCKVGIQSMRLQVGASWYISGGYSDTHSNIVMYKTSWSGETRFRPPLAPDYTV